MIQNKKLIILDLDGVVYKENNLIKDAKAFIDFLIDSNIQYCFLTNNTSYDLHHYKKKLSGFEIKVNDENIITPLKLINHYLEQNHYKKVFILGSESLKKYVYKNFDKEDNNPDCIVIGMDDNITLKKISKIINLSNDNNIPIIATNPDLLIPKTNRYDLECGAIIMLVEKFTTKKVKVIGKPNSFAFEYIQEKFNIDKSNTLMIGDTYDTDIYGAINSAIDAVWVGTGNKLPENIDLTSFSRVSNLIELSKIIEKNR